MCVDKSASVFLVLLISVFLLAIMTLGLAFSSGIINDDPRELSFQSPEGRTQPVEGYVTPLYDPWTTVTVTVESDEEVEVHLYSANYRGGRVFNNAGNESEIRDEFLAAGDVTQRTGTNVVLSDFTSVSNQYMVDVMEPGSTIPSAADYTITIEASTAAIASLLYLGLLLMALFAVMMVYHRFFLKERKPTVKEERPMYAGGYQQGQWRPYPPVPQHPPPPQPVQRPPPPPTMPPQGPTGQYPRSQETPVVEWE